MGQKNKAKAKTRLDAYYRLAKDQGYRARSAFKLIQLNRKYDFLGKSKSVVDLCAAPGGWCQVAAKHMPVGSKIVGIDLLPIQPIRGVKTFVGDITDDKSRKMIMTYLKKEPVDVVIHDGAPNVGGVWSRDLFQQNALVLSSLKTACSLLKLGGWFVTKVFRSQDFQKLMWIMKQLFDKCEATKPLASRMESAEIFVVCAGYKAPKTIDPKFFNAQEAFAEVGQERIIGPTGTGFIPKSNVPQGYDDFATVSHKVATMSDFMRSEDAKSFLKTHHEIRFPEEDRHYLDSKYSKKELVYLCRDLQQVGDADLRRLVRWKEQLIREAKRFAGSDDDEPAAEVNEDDLEAAGIDVKDMDAAQIARELLELRKKKAKEAKKAQRKLVDRKLKQVRGLINHDVHDAAAHAEDLGRGGGGDDVDEKSEHGDDDWTIANVAAIDEEALAGAMDKHFEEPAEFHNVPLDHVVDVDINKEIDYDMGEGGGEESERLQVEEGNEDAYDVDAYGNYILAEPQKRAALFDKGIVDEDEMYDGEDEEDDGFEDGEVEGPKSKLEETLDEAGKQSKWKRRQVNIDKVLNQTFPKPRDGKRKRNVDEELIEMEADGPVQGERGNRLPAARTRFEGARAGDSEEDGDDSSDNESFDSEFSVHASDDDIEIDQGRVDSRRKKAIVPDIGKLTSQELVKQQRKQVIKENKSKKKKKKEDDDFEEIPLAMTDPDIRARTLAMATKMLSKKSRRDMMDSSINRFMNNDDDDLPDWFIKDEQRNCKVEMPVTAAEIEAQRQRFIELSSRPSKKVMEAVGRKRRKAQRMLKGLIEKGKTDPRAREKASSTNVRTLMRSKAIKGEGNAKKKGPMDPKLRGQKKREKQRMKRR